MMEQIAYKEGYKYQLVEDYSVMTPILTGGLIMLDWCCLFPDGRLTVQKGYAWDGASGPTIDTPASMRPSLVHDCLCQMMKERKLDYGKWSQQVHAFFKVLCKEDGMWEPRATIWHMGVVIGQGGNPDIPDDVVVLRAPR